MSISESRLATSSSEPNRRRTNSLSSEFLPHVFNVFVPECRNGWPAAEAEPLRAAFEAAAKAPGARMVTRAVAEIIARTT
jgi:hypothetical protein